MLTDFGALVSSSRDCWSSPAELVEQLFDFATGTKTVHAAFPEVAHIPCTTSELQGWPTPASVQVGFPLYLSPHRKTRSADSRVRKAQALLPRWDTFPDIAARATITMLWKPSTYGESLFLEIYTSLGAAISVDSEHGFDYLVSGHRFQEFARLLASLEVFYRCLRCSERFSREEGHLPASALGKELRLSVELPAALYNNRRFLEVAKQAGRIVHEDRNYTPTVERELWRSEPFECYLCGNPLSDKRKDTEGKDNPKYKSIDHLWPLSLGGQSDLENLLPACKGCNSNRWHAVTWATGPVASYHLPKTGTNFPASWKFALAMFSLGETARGERRPLTLKEAARRVRPIVPNIDTSARTPFVFFETIQQLEKAD